MKKLLLIAILMLALVFTVVACTGGKTPDDTTVGDTTVETPTEAPTDEPDTPAPDTDEPETPAPDTDEPETPAPDTDEPDTPAPDTDEPETPEPETADPADPVWIIEPDALSTVAGGGGYIAGAEVMEEGGYKFVRITVSGGDSQFVVANNLGTMPKYLAISYRANADKDGEMFIGTDNGPNGTNDHHVLGWNQDNSWNLMIVDVSTVANVVDGNVGYFRLDPFRDVTDGYIDIEFIAFFNTAEYAQAYDFELHKAPHWTEATDKVKHQSFDQLYAGTGNADNGPENVFTPGASADWDFVVDYSDIAYADFTVDTLTYWGWIGFMGEKGQFGYQIDMNPAVYNDEWAFVGGDHEGIIGAAQGVGADSGHRMKIAISIAGLEGEHTVRAMYKTADGMEICLNEFTVKLPVPVVIPDTAMNVTVNAADNFAADTPVGHVVDFADSNLKNVFPFMAHPAGDPSRVINGENGAYFNAQGFSEAFVSMDGTYVYTVHSLASGNQKFSSFFVRGAQSVNSADLPAPEPDNGLYPINNYYETDGQPQGHAGAGIQLWTADSLLLGVKYYVEETKTKIGTAYWNIDVNCVDKDVQIIDTGAMIYISVDGELVATVELVGTGKAYEKLTVSGGATFCEQALVTIYRDLKGDNGLVANENGQYVLDGTLVVDTPMTDIGIATRIGTLSFTSVSIAPLSSVEIPQIPGGDEPEEPVVPEVEKLVIPQDQWVISGHVTTLVTPDVPNHGDMITAGGVSSAALLHQGSIALGEIDLSKYSKVVIYWGSDNGPGTQDLYAKNEHNRFALVNADKNMQMSPNEDTIIVAKTYELHGWAIAPFEIDLTGIDYNGPVFLTHDSLAGGFALVYSIEFVA